MTSPIFDKIYTSPLNVRIFSVFFLSFAALKSCPLIPWFHLLMILTQFLQTIHLLIFTLLIEVAHVYAQSFKIVLCIIMYKSCYLIKLLLNQLTYPLS